MIAAIVAIVVLALCLAPILAAHPSAYRQLVINGASQTALGNANSGGYHGSGKSVLQLWKESLLYGYDKVILICGCLIFAFLCRLFDRSPEKTAYSRFILAVFSLLLLLFSMPGKYTYLWFLGSWLLIACVALGWQVTQSLPSIGRLPLPALGVFIWLFASMAFVRTKAILWTLPADQSLSFNMKRVRDEVPAGAGILTTEYWWALAGRNPVYDTLFSDPGLTSFDYVALAGNGSGRPGTPQLPAVAIGGSQWQNTYDHLRSKSPAVFGFPLSHSGYGFGPYILKKIK
jgi:hypothetical protein